MLTASTQPWHRAFADLKKRTIETFDVCQQLNQLQTPREPNKIERWHEFLKDRLEYCKQWWYAWQDKAGMGTVPQPLKPPPILTQVVHELNEFESTLTRIQHNKTKAAQLVTFVEDAIQSLRLNAVPTASTTQCTSTSSTYLTSSASDTPHLPNITGWNALLPPKDRTLKSLELYLDRCIDGTGSEKNWTIYKERSDRKKGEEEEKTFKDCKRKIREVVELEADVCREQEKIINELQKKYKAPLPPVPPVVPTSLPLNTARLISDLPHPDFVLNPILLTASSIKWLDEMGVTAKESPPGTASSNASTSNNTAAASIPSTASSSSSHASHGGIAGTVGIGTGTGTFTPSISSEARVSYKQRLSEYLGSDVADHPSLIRVKKGEMNRPLTFVRFATNASDDNVIPFYDEKEALDPISQLHLDLREYQIDNAKHVAETVASSYQHEHETADDAKVQEEILQKLWCREPPKERTGLFAPNVSRSEYESANKLNPYLERRFNERRYVFLRVLGRTWEYIKSQTPKDTQPIAFDELFKYIKAVPGLGTHLIQSYLKRGFTETPAHDEMLWCVAFNYMLYRSKGIAFWFAYYLTEAFDKFKAVEPSYTKERLLKDMKGTSREWLKKLLDHKVDVVRIDQEPGDAVISESSEKGASHVVITCGDGVENLACSLLFTGASARTSLSFWEDVKPTYGNSALAARIHLPLRRMQFAGLHLGIEGEVLEELREYVSAAATTGTASASSSTSAPSLRYASPRTHLVIEKLDKELTEAHWGADYCCQHQIDLSVIDDKCWHCRHNRYPAKCEDPVPARTAKKRKRRSAKTK